MNLFSVNAVLQKAIKEHFEVMIKFKANTLKSCIFYCINVNATIKQSLSYH